ncbi:ATP-binding protein [Herbiconiux sp. A18JL235]|uniref:Sensor-like histidine kinase SenX3 n=1 Tax=Herbiconiux sp. A18JL235 TaxID=3152363 RepID=A0AB39BKL9_9MICO
MPLLEVGTRPRGRLKVFVRAQLPLLVGTLFVAGVAALPTPVEFGSPLLLGGLAIVLLASLLVLVVPWERLPPIAMIGIPLVDVVGVAFIRAELFPVLPSSGMLTIFPVLWLAFAFGRRGIAVAVLSTVFISSFFFVYRQSWPADLVDWANVVTLPVLIVGVALVVNFAAAQLRRNRGRLVEANEALTEALARSQDETLLSRAILDTVSTAVAFFDGSNRLTLSNQQARDFAELAGFDLGAAEYSGDRVLSADRTSPIPPEEQIVPRALRGETLLEHVEWVGPPDRQRAMVAASSRVHRADGELLGTVIVAYDITELAHAIEIREEFLSTVSHELRTPLTNVTGYLELLVDALEEPGPPATPGAVDPVARGYLDVVARNAELLRTRIDELLAATETTLPPVKRPTDLTELLRGAATAARRVADGKNQTVELRQHTEEECVVELDPDRIGRALREVVDNAVKFSAPGTTIGISHDCSDGRATISVSDQGVGMGRAEQSRIFDRFYRTPYARRQAVQGFGLGLTLARSIVASHDGSISVQSAPDTGTTMTITLPHTT